MAIYEVTYTFIDEQGRTTDRLLLTDQADEAALLTEAGLMKDVLQAFSKSAILKYAYRRVVQVNGTPGAGSNIDAGATFSWASPLVIDPVSKVPDPEEAAKDGTGGIDLTATIVDDYVQKYLAGSWRLNRNNPTQPTAVTAATLDV